MEREWIISTIIKIVLILVLPLELTFGISNGGYTSILISVGDQLFPMYVMGPSLVFVLPMVLVFILPGLIFDYVQYHRPFEMTVRRYFVVAYIFGNQFVLYLCVMPLMTMVAIISWELMLQVQYSFLMALMAAPWGVFLLVVIPFLTKQAAPLRIPKQIGNDTPKSRFELMRSEYNIIAFLLGASIYLTPILIGLNAYPSPLGVGNWYLASASGFYEFGNHPSPVFAFAMLASMYYPSLGLTCAIYLFYAYSVLRYLQGKESRERCLGIGIVSVIASPFVTKVLPFVYTAMGDLLLPIPIAFIVGTIITFTIEPVIVDESIWDESLEREVFGSPASDIGEERKSEEVVPVEQSSQSKDDNEGTRQSGYDWDHREDDVFGGHGN